MSEESWTQHGAHGEHDKPSFLQHHFETAGPAVRFGKAGNVAVPGHGDPAVRRPVRAPTPSTGPTIRRVFILRPSIPGQETGCDQHRRLPDLQQSDHGLGRPGCPTQSAQAFKRPACLDPTGVVSDSWESSTIEYQAPSSSTELAVGAVSYPVSGASWRNAQATMNREAVHEGRRRKSSRRRVCRRGTLFGPRRRTDVARAAQAPRWGERCCRGWRARYSGTQ